MGGLRTAIARRAIGGATKGLVMSISTARSTRKSRRNAKPLATIAALANVKILTMLPLLIGFYDPTGALIDTKSALDPREYYCNDYNAFSDELGTGIVARPIL
jgi:hypothetical protein